MMRIVLDTNVFMSGIFWSGPPAKILEAWQQEKIKLVMSVEILGEYMRIGDNLAKKYKGVDLTPFFNLLSVHGEFYSPVQLETQISRDPDDEKFIATALAADCRVIVSGDKDLLEIDGYTGIRVVKPAVFVEQIH